MTAADLHTLLSPDPTSVVGGKAIYTLTLTGTTAGAVDVGGGTIVVEMDAAFDTLDASDFILG